MTLRGAMGTSNLNRSNLSHGLNSSIKKSQTQSLLRTNHKLAKEIFEQSLSISSIGHLSGYHQKQQPFEAIQQNNQLLDDIEQVASQRSSTEKIDFSTHPEQTKKYIPQESILDKEESRYFFIRSFRKGKQAINSQVGCFICSQDMHKNQSLKCKVQLIQQSIFQLHTEKVKGEFSMLFLSINFNTQSVQLFYEKIPENKQIKLSFGEYCLLIEHQSKLIANAWSQLLQKIIDSSRGTNSITKGKQLSLNILSNQQQFYKCKYRTQQQFIHNSQTGDILLFQDDHFFAKAQRFFTNSDYDHVGVVIKDFKYGILIFQSNGGSGVCLTPWKYVVKYKWYKHIPKITWRKLGGVPRDNQFLAIAEAFILKYLKTNYHFSFSKLLSNQSVIRSDQPNRETGEFDQEKMKEGFFCSELIATFYKELGLLTRNKEQSDYQPACKFYPKDFTQKSGRKLIKGTLSEEYTIFFDDSLLALHYKF